MEEQTIKFPQQTSSPYKYIFYLIQSGYYLVSQYKQGQIFDRDKPLLFATLIHIERSIDAYRGFIPPDSSAKYPDENLMMLSMLDEFRELIWQIRKDIGETAAKAVLDELGESFKLRFRKM